MLVLFHVMHDAAAAADDDDDDASTTNPATTASDITIKTSKSKL